MFYDYMIYIVFDFMMAVIMFLFGMWFYKSEGKAANFLSGYNMKSADERKKYDENAMRKAYGKRMMFMSVPFIIGIIIDIQYLGIGCLIASAPSKANALSGIKIPISINGTATSMLQVTDCTK